MPHMKVVFLHGINHDDPDHEWLAGLNRGLVQVGYEPIGVDDVVAPSYSDLLSAVEIEADLPPVTYKAGDDRTSRSHFERRQARVQRTLRKDPGVRTHGFNHVPGPVLRAGQDVAIDHLEVFEQVRNYVKSDDVRGAIMNRILGKIKHLRGDILLIGHSLGSVIAIDILDHLPTDLHVRRFITIGSPAHSPALRGGREKLLKKFPYAVVDDWSNFVETRDIVTGGRGLASVFHGAQDFVIDIGVTHAADKYLGHEAVAGLIADVLYRKSAPPPPSSASLVGRLDDTDALSLLSLQFGRRLSTQISVKDVKRRYEDALTLIQEDLEAKAQQMVDDGRPIAPEIRELLDGQLPPVPRRWEIHEAVRHLGVLATSNTVAPYEIETGDAALLALPHIAVDLGFRGGIGDKVREAVEQINDELLEKGSFLRAFGGSTTTRIILGAAGIALVAAAPIGLMVAAPAAAYGAAALTGSLAAFGPGGMVGGLAMLGGLASTGTLMATVAATVGSGDQVARDPRVLISRIAGEYSLKLLGMPHDESLWEQVTEFETQISAEYNRLEPFSDKKCQRLSDLETAKGIMDKMIAFMVKKGLGPELG